MIGRISFNCVIVLSLLLGSSRAWAQDAKSLVRASIHSDVSRVEAGKAFKVGVLLKIAPNWHVYWVNSGDAGIPTTVKFALPEGFTVGPLQYPAPSRFEESDITTFGYSNEVMLIATITPPARLESADVRIGADVNYLVCEKSCVPGDAKLSLDLPVGQSAPSADAALVKEWSKRIPVAAKDWPAVKGITMSLQPRAERPTLADFSLVVEWNVDVTEKLEWFPPASDGLLFSKIRVETNPNRVTRVTGTVERLAGLRIGSDLESVLASADPARRAGIAIPLDLSGAPWKE